MDGTFFQLKIFLPNGTIINLVNSQLNSLSSHGLQEIKIKDLFFYFKTCIYIYIREAWSRTIFHIQARN